MENGNYNIKYNGDKLNVLVEKCEDNQIIMYDAHGFHYCENPICKSFCPVDKSAICEKGRSEKINDPNINQCKCMDGWFGDECEQKEYIKLK